MSIRTYLARSHTHNNTHTNSYPNARTHTRSILGLAFRAIRDFYFSVSRWPRIPLLHLSCSESKLWESTESYARVSTQKRSFVIIPESTCNYQCCSSRFGSRTNDSHTKSRKASYATSIDNTGTRSTRAASDLPGEVFVIKVTFVDLLRGPRWCTWNCPTPC